MNDYDILEEIAKKNMKSVRRFRYMDIFSLCLLTLLGFTGIIFESQFFLVATIFVAFMVLVSIQLTKSLDTRAKKDWAMRGILMEIGSIMESFKKETPSIISTLIWDIMKTTRHISYLDEVILIRLFSVYSDVEQYNKLISNQPGLEINDSELKKTQKLLLFNIGRFLDSLK
ncbi:MAG: hypothetical protein ACTSWQ_02675 [Candidatus Thorarchaeota archaeon]